MKYTLEETLLSSSTKKLFSESNILIKFQRNFPTPFNL